MSQPKEGAIPPVLETFNTQIVTIFWSLNLFEDFLFEMPSSFIKGSQGVE